MNREPLTLILFAAAIAAAGCVGTPSAQPPMSLADLQMNVAGIGRKVAPAPTAALYAPRILDREPYAGVAVTRDIAYARAERNRLDLFVPSSGVDRPRPVLVFVHGGAYVAGNRRLSPQSPFYDNVMLWAVRHGMVGVNMSYRLAPANPWPAGPEDIGEAIRWVHDHIGAYGGDPARVFLLGHSAGATHVASYVAHERFQRVPGSGLAGAMMLSGIYRVTREIVAGGATYPAYFGTDASRYEEESSLNGLVATRVPLWVGNAQLDPPSFEDQAKLLRSALCAAGKCAAGVSFQHHSHMSQAYSIDSDDPEVGDAMQAFIEGH